MDATKQLLRRTFKMVGKRKGLERSPLLRARSWPETSTQWALTQCSAASCSSLPLRGCSTGVIRKQGASRR